MAIITDPYKHLTLEELREIKALQREEETLQRLSLDDKATSAQRQRLKMVGVKVATILDRATRRANKDDPYDPDYRIMQ